MKFRGLLIALFLFLTVSLKAQITPLWCTQIQDTVFTAGGSIYSSQFIKSDISGNVYCAGTMKGSMDFDPGPGEFILSNSFLGKSLIISKYSSSGSFIWAKQILQTSDTATAMPHVFDLDSNCNVYFGSEYVGMFDVDPDTSVSNFVNSFYGSFLLKLDSAGNFVWCHKLGDYHCYPITLNVTPQGTIYISGFGGSGFDIDAGPGIEMVCGVTHSAYLAKITSDDSLVWAKSLHHGIMGIAIDDNENIFLTSESAGNIDFDEDTLTSPYLPPFPSSVNGFIVKRDSAGNYLWSKIFAGNNTHMYNYSIKFDRTTNEIYFLSGFSGTIDFDPETGIDSVGSTSPFEYDLALIRMNQSGLITLTRFLEWHQGCGGLCRSIIDMSMLNNGNVIIGSYYREPIDLDPGPSTTLTVCPSGNNSGYYFLSIDHNGNYLWSIDQYCQTTFDSWSPYGFYFDENDSSFFATGSLSSSQGVDIDPGPSVFNISTDAFKFDATIVKYSIDNSTTGIESSDKMKTLNVFPNPATEKINFDLFSDFNTSVSIKLIDMTGRIGFQKVQIISIGYNKCELSVEDMPPGVYSLLFTGEKLNIQRTVILQ